ncbi:MAG: hypothetical protein HZA24_03785 [Nitrospirae bacterium]|nr:hypothetical protein [Nitrospirota bacterium]
MAARGYASNVFINCPFDDAYLALRNAIVFAVFDCGFTPRCALEENNGGDVRFTKIQRLIANSKFGIHDISRTGPDAATGLPRFNMPLELGVFIGARHFGDETQQRKNCLILDFEPYRYQAFISDIAGNDIQSHENNPERAIGHVRNWLNDASGRKTIPGGRDIVRRYRLFRQELPNLCAKAHVTVDELMYNDYSRFVSAWLKANER